jgi:hypothetical protein
MFTRLEKGLIVAMLILNIGFSVGAYAAYDGMTLKLLSITIASWSLGLVIFFGILIGHYILSKNVNDRRIIVKDN